MKYLHRAASNGSSVPVDPFTTLGSWAKSLPALSEFLVEPKWEDDTPRRLGTVTIFYDEGSWKVCLNDKDSGAVAFASASSPAEALAAADKGLQAGTLDWRGQRPLKGRK